MPHAGARRAQRSRDSFNLPRRSSYTRTRANSGTPFAVFFFIFEYDSKGHLQPPSSNFKWSNEVWIWSLRVSYTDTTYFGPRRSSYTRIRANSGIRFAVFIFIFGYDPKGISNPFLLILNALMRFQYRFYTHNTPTRHIPGPGEADIHGHKPILVEYDSKGQLQPFSSNFKCL